MHIVSQLLCALGAYACATVTATYLQLGPMPLIRAILFVLMGAAALRISSERVWHKRAIVSMCGFSLLLSATLVVGYHIHVEDAYAGTIDVNYLTPLNASDGAALVAMAGGIFVVAYGGYVWACTRRLKRARGNHMDVGRLEAMSFEPVSLRQVAICAGILFLAWLPYLLTSWPGHVFGDTIVSLRQVFGDRPLNNHHPIPYTLFLGACIRLALALGQSVTVGMAVSTVLQMLVLAFSVGMLVTWVRVRGRLARPVAWLMLGCFALTPHVASFSVAMWKDPLFTAALIWVSVQLVDAIWFGGASFEAQRWQLPTYATMLLLAMFTRNNGLYLVVLTLVGLVALLLARKRHGRADGWLMRLTVTTAVCATCAGIVTGPVYDALGVSGPRVESAGVLVNQMARVVACGGDMTDSDRAFMDAVLPLEKYKQVYTPCCVDKLKWNKSFDSSALKNGFVSHWVSMGLRNPLIYVESWILETYGFWTINCPDINSIDWNVRGGAPRNQRPADDGTIIYGITPANLLGADEAFAVFPQDEWSVPLGWIAWALAYVCVVLALEKRPAWIVGLLPSVGLVLTLVMASPIRYWARYGMLLQVLLPLYALVAYKALVVAPQDGRDE